MDLGMPGKVGRGRLTVDVRRQGTAAVVTPEGELDHHTANLLEDRLESCLQDGLARLVVNCTGLQFCDSTGLNVLLGARLKAEAAGGGVHLAGMQPAVSRVFEITGAGAVFTLHKTLDSAVADTSDL